MKDVKAKIQKLVAELNYWNQQYFDHNHSVVSDQVYDTHLKQLHELEQKYPQYILPNSPTQTIGAKPKAKFAKVKHQKPMLSLDKAYNMAEVAKFLGDVSKKLNTTENLDYLIEPKIDGLSIALIYQQGQLVRAVTRGDGQIGEDVSANVIGGIATIPQQIAYLQDLEVRGEIYIGKQDFAQINTHETTTYANPRNLASGTLRQLDPTIIKQRKLTAFIYDVVDYSKHHLTTQMAVLNFLIQYQFPVFTNFAVVQTLEQISSFISDFEQRRPHLDYEVDGLVLKLNPVEHYETLGYTSKFPKSAIAYKFADEVVDTILEDIFVSIGRTGMVTYNAKLKPVQLTGSLISAATLHNYAYIDDLKLNIGDEVSIKKAGEIIPKVIALATKNSHGTFAKITTCPSCQGELVDTKTLNNQRCPNPYCPDKNIRKIVHFASRQALNIEGLAEGVVSKLYQLGFVKTIGDLFTLERFRDSIIAHHGFGHKFWTNLWQAIQQARQVSLERLIFALGIPQLGLKGAKLVAQFIQSFDQLLTINVKSLAAIRDIGPITIEAIAEYLKTPENIDLIQRLLALGLNPHHLDSSGQHPNFFTNKTFVITGTFKKPRATIVKTIEALGARVATTVSKHTSALLVGHQPGTSKYQRAQAEAIPIIEEPQLEALIAAATKVAS